MKLGKKQEIFSRNLGLLLVWLATEGYRFRIKEVQRTREQAMIYASLGSGIVDSLHIDSLAADIDLFDKDGNYLTDYMMYSEAGRYWKALGGVWGGDFSKKDGRHFEYNERMSVIWQKPDFDKYSDLGRTA